MVGYVKLPYSSSNAVMMMIEAVVTVALIAVIDEWNDFIWPLLVTNSVQMRTLPIGLMFLKETEGVDQWGPIMAGTVLVVLVFVLLEQEALAETGNIILNACLATIANVLREWSPLFVGSAK